MNKTFLKLFFAILLLSLSVPAVLTGAFGQTITAQQQKAKCKAITLKGSQCSRNALITGYCKQHDPNTKKCAGLTKSGQRCKRPAGNGSDFCFQHKK